MKLNTTFFLLLISLSAGAQYFEWASTSSNLFAGYKCATLDATGNMITAAEQPQIDHYNGKPSFLYDAAGNENDVSSMSNSILVVSYSPAGKINWIKRLVSKSSTFEPTAMSADSKGNIYLFGYAGRSFYVQGVNRHFNYDEEKNQEMNGYFVYCLNTKGEFKWVHCDMNSCLDDAETFEALPSGGFIISGSTDKNIITKKGNVNVGKGGNYVMKVDENLEAQWANVAVSDAGIGTRHIPPCRAKAGADESVYVVGDCFEGITFSDGSKHNAPILDSVNQYNRPYESYLMNITKDGNLKWVKTSGSKALFNAIDVTAGSIYITGSIQVAKTIFGLPADTVGNKKMVLMAFDKKGNARWIKTTNADNGGSLATDADDNVYVFVHSKNYALTSGLILGTDTIKKCYERFILASYSSKGFYRWYKMSNIMLNGNVCPTVLIDHCNNIYATGEMWYALKVQTSIFDGVFMKGDGYGAAPFAAKIKNSIEREACRVSPGPWKLINYPNPFNGITTLRATCTSTDEKASLYVFDLSGRLIATILKDQALQAGKQEFSFDGSNTPPGKYIAVLKGSDQVATAEMEIVR